jgi:hypothetical protein
MHRLLNNLSPSRDVERRIKLPLIDRPLRAAAGGAAVFYHEMLPAV